MIISVIIPVYNVEHYIRECIESLLKSSISNSDIEFIFVDDGSTDSSLNIVKKYVDKRIRIIEKTHSNVYETWKLGVLHAKGKYIMSVDPDDFVSPDLFKTIIDNVEANNSDLVVFNYSIYIKTNKKCAIIDKAVSLPCGIYDKKSKEFLSYITPKLEGRCSIFFRWNKVFKKEKCMYLFNKVNKIDDYCCVFSEDTKIATFMYMICDNVFFINDPFYFYRLRHDSTSHSIDNLRQKYNETYAYINLLEINQLKFKMNVNYINSLILFKCARIYMSASKLRRFDVANSIYKDKTYNELIKKYHFKNKILAFLLKHNMKRTIYFASKIIKQHHHL